jgi:uncharacterized protein (DUF2147 family)
MAPGNYWAPYNGIMKKYFILFFLVFATALQAQDQNDFVGNWSADGGVIVEIYLHDSAYYAKVKADPNLETNGKVILIQMAKKSDTQLYGGTYYDAELKSEYEAKLKLKNNNTIHLKVLYGLFSKTIIWHRVNALEGKANEIAVSSTKH